MTPERLAEIEELLPIGHCYECGADEYVYELIDALREAQTRVAELEADRDQWKKRADDEYESGGKAFRELVTTIKETEEAWTEETEALQARIAELEKQYEARTVTSVHRAQERDELAATLERVRDVLDEYCTAGCCQHAESNEKQLHDLLLTALGVATADKCCRG